MTLEQSGIVTYEQFLSVLPDEERRRKGPYVIAECFQKIPCNPCTTSCPAHGVTQETINDTPVIDAEKCTGCGMCVSVCPGLACFVIDETAEEGKVWITMPHEIVPVPEKGEEVTVLDREGNPKGTGIVKRVRGGKSMNHTYLVTVSVDSGLIYDVRSIDAGSKTGGEDNE